VQLSLIREMKALQLPVQANSWWQLLHKTLNDAAALQTLSKSAADKDGEQLLQALGILQLWVLCNGELTLGATWPPLLKVVSSCKPACEAVVTYLLSFIEHKAECKESLREILEENLAFFTPSTPWVMQQEAFWQLPSQ
jgi:hypothetical protein